MTKFFSTGGEGWCLCANISRKKKIASENVPKPRIKSEIYKKNYDLRLA